ncbi:OLC1v1006551C2 [Oldenlandia corymbosa var. corymbosa]|nr:OLC1v1006551C2 [Oldenlandia corymbosa var. corymbosa]
MKLENNGFEEHPFTDLSGPCLCTLITPDTVESCDGYYYEFENGTTAIGFILNKEGVMVAVDHSSIPSGSFPQNVIVFHSHLLTTFSGGSKDSLERLPVYLQKKCHEYELKEGKKASAAEASKWLADFLSLHPDSDDRLSLGVLIAGWDNELGPALYKVNGKGKLRQSPYLGAGCGSSGSGGLSYRVLGNLSLADATEVAKKALCLGVCYVPESEGCVSVFHVGCAGVTQVVFGDDIGEWQNHFFSKVPWQRKVLEDCMNMAKKNLRPRN